MKIFLIIVGAIVALSILVIVIKKRRARKEIFFSSEKHPNGFIKYHKKTKIRVKAALQPASSETKEEQKVVAVFRFKGDLKASHKEELSHVIDELVLNKDKIQKAVLLIESPGGSVVDYGQCFSETERLRKAELEFEVCIDTVAASGGYLMSLSANKILAAPFSMVGSIGVVSFIPNVRGLLEKFSITPRTYTSGKYKRTVSFTDQATPEEVNHYEQQLGLIHEQFKQALKKYRPTVNLEEVATGEAWLAKTSVEKNLGLVDEIKCSSDHLLELNKSLTLVEFYEENKKSPLKKWLQAQMNTFLENAQKDELAFF